MSSSYVSMPADSTQAELKAGKKRKKAAAAAAAKKEKKAKKEPKKEGKQSGSSNSSCSSDSDNDSDLDLSKDLKPMGGYIKNREEMMNQMFKSIGVKKLRSMLPEILKPFSVVELQTMCLEQLEGMSKKRILRILDGAEPDTISSSGTEDESLDEDDPEKKGSEDEDGNEAESTEVVATQTQTEDLEVPVVPSPISVHGEGEAASPARDSDHYSMISESPTSSRSRNSSTTDSLYRHSRSWSRTPSDPGTPAGHVALDVGDIDDDPLYAAATPQEEDTESLLAMSGSEEGEILEYTKEELEAMQQQEEAPPEEPEEPKVMEEPPAEEAAAAEASAAPAPLSDTQMEILELEMRARAIKAMLEKKKSAV